MNVALDVRVFRRVLLWGGIVLPTTAIVAAFVVHPWPAQRYLAFYVAPLLLAAPLWIRTRFAENGLAVNQRTVVDAAVLLLSFLRFALGSVLPFSGHTLFLAYTGLTTRERGYQLLAISLFAETTIFKLWIWRDPLSWSIGLALGLGAAAYVRVRLPRPAI